MKTNHLLAIVLEFLIISLKADFENVSPTIGFFRGLKKYIAKPTNPINNTKANMTSIWLTPLFSMSRYK